MREGLLEAVHGGEGLTRRADSALGAEDVLAGLERILASGGIDGSPRSRAFVRSFIVEETLAGRQDGLSLAAIAVHVFGRRPDFDPTVDPIGRIQAGRLRRSLERSYLLEGADNPVRIELPRGGDALRLRWADPAEAPEAGTDGPQPPEEPGGWPSILLWVRSGGTREGGPDEEAAHFVVASEQGIVAQTLYGQTRAALAFAPLIRGETAAGRAEAEQALALNPDGLKRAGLDLD